MELNNELVTQIVQTLMIVFLSGIVSGLVVGLFSKLLGISIKKLFVILRG